MKNSKSNDNSLSATIPEGLGRADLLQLYEKMFLLRRFELKAQEIYRKGLWPGFIHLYVGEEASAVGVCAHLRPTDWITSTHRGHGHALAKGLSPAKLMAELAGKATGCCGGRGGSMHLYAPSIGLFGTNGIVAGGLAPAVGVGLSARVRGTDQVTVSFFGDGASNHGAFHESINLASVQRVPVVFVCENNTYATATPLAMATLNTELASRAAGYGIPGEAVDGNDVLAVWETAGRAIERARSGGGPTLIEVKTYRVVGHHEGDQVYGTYRTKEEVEKWKERCPIAQFRHRLILEWKLVTEEELAVIEKRVDETIEEAAQSSASDPACDPSTLHDHVWTEPINPPMPSLPAEPQMVEQGWLDAVRDGIAEEMRRVPSTIYLGEGIGERGGTFGHTKGLWSEFGGERVIDTPICETGFTGAATGASATGCPAVADLMFTDFIFEAASQVIHQSAKLHYMSNGQISVPMVIRAGSGIVKSAGAQHSGTYHSMWAHVPGLMVVMPSTPADAKGLMKSAMRTMGPVIFLEPKALFSTRGEVAQGDDVLVPLGQARIAHEGRDLTVVSFGLMLHRCLEAAALLEDQGLSCEVLDLRTLVPLDVESIVASLSKTHRLLVVDEGFSMCGMGGEIAAQVMEHGFDELRGPVGRLHTEPVVHPFAPPLENEMVPSVEKIVQAAKSVVAGVAPVQRRPATGVSGVGKTASSIPVSQIAATPRAAQSAGEENKSSEGLEPFCMPHGDLTSEGGTVVRWLKQAGEAVKAGEPLVEVETEKAVMEVEASVSGVLTDLLVSTGDEVKHGQQMASIRVGEIATVIPGEPFCMPHGDLTSEGGTVVRWLKQTGEAFKAGEPLVEVETEKAVMEVEAPMDGVLLSIQVSAGEAVKHGQQMGTIQPA